MINLKSKIYVAGHKGLVGSAIIRKLKKKGYKNLIFRSRKQLDLKNPLLIVEVIQKVKPFVIAVYFSVNTDFLYLFVKFIVTLKSSDNKHI